jgi:hypothetical protein
LTFTAVTHAETALNVEPQLVSLGSFLAQDEGGSNLNPGVSTVRVFSTEAWNLNVTLTQPARRLSDNLELPLERVRQVFPDLAPLCGYQSVRLDYGPGNPDPQTLTYDWHVMQARLAQYLDKSDPPGLYRFSVNLEIQSRDNQTNSHQVPIMVEFTVLPYVEVVVPDPNFTVTVEHPGEPSQSDPVYVVVRSNCAWTLEIGCMGYLMHSNTLYWMDTNSLSWLVGSGDEWETMIPSFTPAQRTMVLAARGRAPAPFTENEVEIPLQLQAQTEHTTVEGTYSAEIRFAVHSEDPAR